MLDLAHLLYPYLLTLLNVVLLNLKFAKKLVGFAFAF